MHVFVGDIINMHVFVGDVINVHVLFEISSYGLLLYTCTYPNVRTHKQQLFISATTVKAVYYYQQKQHKQEQQKYSEIPIKRR